jgi:hypothetical protein
MHLVYSLRLCQFTLNSRSPRASYKPLYAEELSPFIRQVDICHTDLPAPIASIDLDVHRTTYDLVSKADAYQAYSLLI